LFNDHWNIKQIMGKSKSSRIYWKWKYNLWDTAKTVLRKKVIALSACIKKKNR
jgi:hypothetical protein